MMRRFKSGILNTTPRNFKDIVETAINLILLCFYPIVLPFTIWYCDIKAVIFLQG